MRSLKHETMTVSRAARTGLIGPAISQSALGNALEPARLQSDLLFERSALSSGASQARLPPFMDSAPALSVRAGVAMIILFPFKILAAMIFAGAPTEEDEPY